jgi:hypothetical protein
MVFQMNKWNTLMLKHCYFGKHEHYFFSITLKLKGDYPVHKNSHYILEAFYHSVKIPQALILICMKGDYFARLTGK